MLYQFYQFINYLFDYFRLVVIYAVGLNFVLLLIFMRLCRKSLLEFFKKINKKTWIMMLSIFLIGLLLRLFISPHQFLTFADETSYMEAAKNIMNFFPQGNYFYFRSIGWPFILAIAFGLFGISIDTAFYASSILGALTIFNIFFIAFLFSKKESIAIYSAFFFAILPLHILWSGSAETNIPSLFFLTLGLFFCLLYFQNKNNHKLFCLALAGMGFASQFRPENHVVFAVILGVILFLIFLKDKKFNFKFVFPVIFIIMLIAPDLVINLRHRLSFNFIEVDNKVVSVGYQFLIKENSLKYGKYLFNSSFHPYIFSTLYLGGLIYLFFKKREAFFCLMCWLLFFYLIFYSFFLKGIGQKSRIFLIFYPATVVLAAYLVDFLKGSLKSQKLGKICITFLLLIILVSFSPYIKNIMFPPNRPQEILTDDELGVLFPFGKTETRLIKFAEKEIPKDCIVFANLPEMLTTTNLNTQELDSLQNYKNLFNNYGCALFFKDFTCYLNLSSPELQKYRSNCKKMQEYSLNPLKNFFIVVNGKQYEFGFYEVSNKQ